MVLGMRVAVAGRCACLLPRGESRIDGGLDRGSGIGLGISLPFLGTLVITAQIVPGKPGR